MRWVLLFVAGAACGNSNRGMFTDKIVPPAVFDKLHLGMTALEAKAAVPAIEQEADGGPLDIPTGTQVHLHIEVEGDAYRIKAFDVVVPDEHLELTLTKLWGVPEHAHLGIHDRAVWRSSATGWNANLFCDPGDCLVHFSAYNALSVE